MPRERRVEFVSADVGSALTSATQSSFVFWYALMLASATSLTICAWMGRAQRSALP